MGNNINKYRVHEVAKDFGLPTKDIVEILTKYAAAPKNHTGGWGALHHLRLPHPEASGVQH